MVATTSIWADITEHVACDGLVRVETLVPVGSDPHGFEPSLRDRDTMERAALVVSNGLGLEEGLEDTLDEVAASGTPVVAVAEQVDTIPFAAVADDHEDHEEGEVHEGDDPHVWFDPVRIAPALDEIARALVEEVGLDSATVQGCLDDYADELAAVDAEIEQMVATVPPDRRALVTNHDALGYFADRYGFEVVGTVIPSGSSLAETNPAQLSALAATIEETGVDAIFVETQMSESDARALADEVGAELVRLFTGTLGPEGSGADSYIGLLRTDAAAIVVGLGGSAG